jgi:Tfp pilus assembly protein PilN
VSASLNLASQPFRNRALPWTITGIITLVSLVSLFLLISQSRETGRRADVAEREVQSLREQRSALTQKAEEVKQALTPEQYQTLQAAQTLVERKRFSWARLFADLEAALPSSVRVTRIKVRDVARRGGRMVADLELAVISRNPADVPEMIAEMDRAGIFQAQLAAQNLRKGTGESGTESTLQVLYQPRAGSPTNASANNNSIAAATAAAANGEAR